MHQGQTVALLGASGVGKTQLLRCVAGLQSPTGGRVVLDGHTTPVAAGEVGVVFQNYPLLKHRTIWGNLKLAAGKNQKKDEEINVLLERFGILDKKGFFPSQLSGGQRQRVAIIQQMLCSNHLILMDEPFSGLDVRMKTEVCKLINEVSIVDELNTTIFTTHDITTALMIADTVWIMGFERDAAGNKIPGATIVKQIDLIERGLAWLPDPSVHPSFTYTTKEITQIFMTT
jgi:ABC-type nitrate/sulfonate/bicarbonate transport system ATPase subunit